MKISNNGVFMAFVWGTAGALTGYVVSYALVKLLNSAANRVATATN